jgi:hypothetical protein
VAAAVASVAGPPRAVAARLRERGFETAARYTERGYNEAIADALERPRPEVFVPRSLGVTLRLYQASPPRMRALFSRAFGLEELYGTVDPKTRADYEASLG